MSKGRNTGNTSETSPSPPLTQPRPPAGTPDIARASREERPPPLDRNAQYTYICDARLVMLDWCKTRARYSFGHAPPHAQPPAPGSPKETAKPAQLNSTKAPRQVRLEHKYPPTVPVAKQMQLTTATPRAEDHAGARDLLWVPRAGEFAPPSICYLTCARSTPPKPFATTMAAKARWIPCVRPDMPCGSGSWPRGLAKSFL